MHNFKRAIDDFNELIDNGATYKKNVYILLSIAYWRS